MFKKGGFANLPCPQNQNNFEVFSKFQQSYLGISINIHINTLQIRQSTTQFTRLFLKLLEVELAFSLILNKFTLAV